MLGYIYWLYIERFFFELNRAVYRLAIFICKYSAWVSSAQSLRKKKNCEQHGRQRTQKIFCPIKLEKASQDKRLIILHYSSALYKMCFSTLWWIVQCIRLAWFCLERAHYFIECFSGFCTVDVSLMLRGCILGLAGCTWYPKQPLFMVVLDGWFQIYI